MLSPAQVSMLFVEVAHYLTDETSHKRIDLSSDPEARVLESGLQAMVEIPAKCPSSICNCFPVARSQTLMVASAAITSPG